jgi:carboxyl-terminal processing protease
MPKRNLFVLFVMIAAGGIAWLAREHTRHGRRFGEVLAAIDGAYIEPVDRQTLFDAAMEGVFAHLDEHSAFVSGAGRRRLEAALDQEFGGVGLELAEIGAGKGLEVVSPVLGSPAWRAGIATGDRIMAIDGIATREMPLHEALRRLRGKAGTQVTIALDVVAEPTGETRNRRTTTLVREVVRTESVLGDRRRADGSWDWEVEGEPGTWLVRITSFGERTADELRRALDAISDRRAVADAPAGGLVIDLRGNAGGLLASAVEACDLLLDDGVIVSTRGRTAGASGDVAVDVRRASRGAALADMPIAVLVDGLTASAAEVMAACLQDHGRAVVVGSRSFGKGTVQSLLPLSDGSGLVKLTTSEYLRPSRANIHRRADDDAAATWGVTPDAGVEIMPTGRQIELARQWRRIRDAVPAAGRSPPSAAPTHAALPRQADVVLAVAIDRLRTMPGAAAQATERPEAARRAGAAVTTRP